MAGSDQAGVAAAPLSIAGERGLVDDQRFDRFSRRVAAQASRRGLARAIVGVAVAGVVPLGFGRRAGAQEGTLGAGAACTTTSQCSQAGGPTACADNGWVDDGALNCCRTAGGPCADATFSRDCCGGLYCRNGVCTDLAPTGGLPPGSYCTATSECSQEGGPVECADNGISTDGALNCCRYQGGACSTNAGCCAGLLCTGGVCSGASAAQGTLPLGAACGTTAECAPSSVGTVVCASNNIASDGALNCCLEQGGACGDDIVCCGNLLCVGGRCGFAGSGGGLPPGAVCTSTAECSQAAGPAICSDNGLPGDGGDNCCLLEGVSCSSSSECCAGLDCGDNQVAADGALTCCAYPGYACVSSAGCCGAAFCIDGFCQ
jgi:hypothetical protein